MNAFGNNRPTTSGGGGYGACAGGGLAPIGGGGIPTHHHPLPTRPQNNVKVKRKCMEVMCQGSVLLLVATVIVTIFATVLLSIGLTTRYWEVMVYDGDIINETLARSNGGNWEGVTSSSNSNHSVRSVQFLFDGRLPLVTLEKPGGDNELVYLFPLNSGVWISCIDLEEYEFDKLAQAGYKRERCMDHLSPDSPKPTDARAAWQFRMQNLAIACAMVCLILLGSAIFVGLFGVFRTQISAILVTGVIYVLAALFAIFTLALVHVKHRNRDDFEPLDVWAKLIPDLDRTEEFKTARVVDLGWSLQLAWAGVGVCVLASVMWMSVSKMMRYNPISLVT